MQAPSQVLLGENPRIGKIVESSAILSQALKKAIIDATLVDSAFSNSFRLFSP